MSTPELWSVIVRAEGCDRRTIDLMVKQSSPYPLTVDIPFTSLTSCSDDPQVIVDAILPVINRIRVLRFWSLYHSTFLQQNFFAKHPNESAEPNMVLKILDISFPPDDFLCEELPQYISTKCPMLTDLRLLRAAVPDSTLLPFSQLRRLWLNAPLWQMASASLPDYTPKLAACVLLTHLHISGRYVEDVAGADPSIIEMPCLRNLHIAKASTRACLALLRRIRRDNRLPPASVLCEDVMMRLLGPVAEQYPGPSQDWAQGDKHLQALAEQLFLECIRIHASDGHTVDWEMARFFTADWQWAGPDKRKSEGFVLSKDEVRLGLSFRHWEQPVSVFAELLKPLHASGVSEVLIQGRGGERFLPLDAFGFWPVTSIILEGLDGFEALTDAPLFPSREWCPNLREMEVRKFISHQSFRGGGGDALIGFLWLRIGLHRPLEKLTLDISCQDIFEGYFEYLLPGVAKELTWANDSNNSLADQERSKAKSRKALQGMTWSTEEDALEPDCDDGEENGSFQDPQLGDYGTEPLHPDYPLDSADDLDWDPTWDPALITAEMLD